MVRRVEVGFFPDGEKQRRAIPFYATLLDSIFAAGKITSLRRAHAAIVTTGIAGSDLLRTKLSAAYAYCGLLREAKLIFFRANRRPVFLYNALIRAHAKRRFFTASIELYRDMLLEWKIPDPRTIASVLSACGESASLRHGRALHCTAIMMGFSSEVSVVNSLVVMYAKCGDASCARHLFVETPTRNLVSWTIMIGCLGAHGCSGEALKMFEEMLRRGIQPDATAITSVLSACSRGGMVEEGEKLFREMEERFEVKPTVEHLTCVVDMMGRAGRIEEAETMLEGMECAPDVVLWGALLAACKVHNKLDVALRVAQRACSTSEPYQASQSK